MGTLEGCPHGSRIVHIGCDDFKAFGGQAAGCIRGRISGGDLELPSAIRDERADYCAALLSGGTKDDNCLRRIVVWRVHGMKIASNIGLSK
nr:hypothetical protein [Microvirga vignae]